MTLRNRVVLIILGTLVFITAGPVLVLAARGYYYDFSTRQLVHTGTLVIKTEPRGGAVFLNGENRGDTPFVKRFALPGEYRVEIVKPGYRPWSKKIKLAAGEVATLPPARERIYLLFQKPETLARVATSTPVLAQQRNNYRIATSTLLLGNEILARDLPKFTTSRILVSQNRQIFLLLDETLYQVGEGLVKINDAVRYAAWDENERALVYGSDHEIWLYRPDAARPNELITRSTEVMGQARLYSGIGYFFYASGGKIHALEYDPAAVPNLYNLAETKDQTVPLQMNNAGTELQYYDSGVLVTLKIR